jgi:hypothetical protein
MWSLNDAQTAIQAWYDRLREAYNRGDWKAIGELYNEDSIVEAKRSGRISHGRSKIKAHWKDFVKPKHGNMTSVVIVVKTLVPTTRLVQDGLAFELANQIAVWDGVMTFANKVRKAAADPITLEGLGLHIQECIFNNPDCEIYQL